MIVLKSTQAKVLPALHAASAVTENKTLLILANAKIEKSGRLVKATGTNVEVQISSASEYVTTVSARGTFRCAQEHAGGSDRHA